MISGLKVIGVCGKSGSGKGYVCKVFEEYDIPCIDTDLVYRNILHTKGSKCLLEILSEYGDGVLDVDGRLDRRALANIVFSDKSGEKLSRLNVITHKYILEETLSKIDAYSKEGYGTVIIDAPVLFESRFNELCDLIFCVTAPYDILVERICERDKRSESEAKARLENQIESEELMRLSNDTIVNDGKIDVNEQVLSLIKKYGLGGKRYE